MDAYSSATSDSQSSQSSVAILAFVAYLLLSTLMPTRSSVPPRMGPARSGGQVGPRSERDARPSGPGSTSGVVSEVLYAVFMMGSIRCAVTGVSMRTEHALRLSRPCGSDGAALAVAGDVGLPGRERGRAGETQQTNTDMPHQSDTRCGSDGN